MPHLSSLRYRIAFTIFLLEAVMMALVLWQTLSLAVQASRNQQAAHEEATLNAAHEVARNALLAEEYSELLPYIRSIPYVGGVTEAYVVDYRGHVVAASDLKALGHPLPTLQSSATEQWRTRTIENENEKLGTLAINFSKSKLTDAIRDALNLGISIAITGMAIIAVVGTLMGYLLTRRLEGLTRAAQRFANGDLHTKTGLDGTDEVAEVGRAFDQMATRLREHIATIEESNQRFALAVDGSNDGIWDWVIETDKTYYSPRWQEMLGIDKANLVVSDSINEWLSRVHPEDATAVNAQIDSCVAGHSDGLYLEHRMRRLDGEHVWVLVRGKVWRDGRGKVQRIAGSMSDITHRKTQEVTIQYQAQHDSMTRLPNRIVLQDRLLQAIRNADSLSQSFAVLMMDLDHFKEINDTLGHHVGDAVLQEVAIRVQSVLRQSDTVARFGGDEFTIILSSIDPENVTPIVQKIVSALRPPVSVPPHSLNVEASIGIAFYPQHGTDPTTLIKRADIAMYTAKRSNIGFAVYDATLDPHNENRLNLMGSLRQAIDTDELVLHYQPQLDLWSGEVIGMEALVRWQHPKLGLLYPDTFIPLAERGGLINSMTLWVLSAAMRQRQHWAQAGRDLTVSVNLSVRTLHDLNFPNHVRESLAQIGFDPSYLELEITESAIMADPERANRVLSELSEMGVRLAIDDFGTGYSSLSYLQKLPVHAVKIDKSFVMTASSNSNNVSIIRSIVDLGHNLDLKVVAEGIEDQQALAILRSLGCDRGQGYFFSRPVAAERITDTLKELNCRTDPQADKVILKKSPFRRKRLGRTRRQ